MIPIRFDRTWLTQLSEMIKKDQGWANWDLFQLAIEAAEAKKVPSFETIQCLKHLRSFEPLPHQVEVVKRVVNEMNGRAILADEVGLGKTIEAGLILKEYLIRGLVKKALILVPSSLVLQWTRELNQKFQIPAMAQKKAWMWEKYDILVGSMDTAKRKPHREVIIQQPYDMLIIDEAHKCKNQQTLNWKFINQIPKKYCLLLTATPLQNEIKELYNLVTLLKPGHFGRQTSFQREYVENKRKAKNEAQLREEIQRVLIRNRRQDSSLYLTQRHVHTIPIELSAEERSLYDGVSQFVRKQLKQQNDRNTMLTLILLQKEVCSSRDAVFHTLFKLFQRKRSVTPEVQELIQTLRNVKSSAKVEMAVNLIRQLAKKVVVFTEYRATQEMLIRELTAKGIHAVPFNGKMSRNKKDWMMELFQKRAQVMVATEAGGEGVNLQFCHHIINYDMPWNPMRVEQRIGRVHRLGQKHDVHIYNFATRDTVEEHIIWLLQEKIKLFESIIGKMETILLNWNQLETADQDLLQLMVEANDRSQLRQKLGEWVDSILPSAIDPTPQQEMINDGSNTS